MRNKLTVLIIRDRFIGTVVVVTVRMYYISLYTVLLLLLFGSRKERGENVFFLFVLCFLIILHCITNYYQFIIIVNEI